MTARLQMSGICKAFGTTRALTGVDLEVAAGEVHALIGENGAGKSTLMNILTGAVPADAGEMALDGAGFRPRNPVLARRHGLAMIHQEPALAPDLTTLKNLFLGAEPSRWGCVRSREALRLARGILAELDCPDFPLHQRVADSSPGEQQIVEIARALMSRPRVMVMDEPTSSLGRPDVDALFRVIGRLRERGVSIVYISHFLEECRAVCDRYTVLRDGQVVGTGSMAGDPIPDIIRLMIGRELTEVYPPREPGRPGVPDRPAMTVRSLSGRHKPLDVSFVLQQGEVLGIAGLVGAGRTETLRCLFGLDGTAAGHVEIDGTAVGSRSPGRSLNLGVGMLSENRAGEGLLIERSIADNLIATRYDKVATAGVISTPRQLRRCESLLERLQVAAPDVFAPVRALSGGNQQRVALGRLLHHEADVLLLDEPTRGVDIASKSTIYRIIRDLAAEGRAIVFVSAYLPELLGVCDTIGVMTRGRMSAVRPVREWTEQTLMQAAVGHESAR